ncbi:hypothetical protein L2E82_40381 [Cichorium intybus]|uniref:Uncharacterized protein n=1 Tax=Cichorium intybus TaxID=13427 RepID=A0ACB9ALH5_CICIN|nr:hypothetical protein L2E82_40381 [Cichorium intybus]
MSNSVFLKNSIWLNKNPVIPGCTFFLSLGLAAARLDSPTPLKVGLTHHPQEVLNSPDFGKVKTKSLLGKSKIVKRNETNGTERRVQWTDVSGGELFMVREFEPSEHSGSDVEFGNGNERISSCRFNRRAFQESCRMPFPGSFCIDNHVNATCLKACQWVIAPHELPIQAGYVVSVFLVNHTVLALSEQRI